MKQKQLYKNRQKREGQRDRIGSLWSAQTESCFFPIRVPFLYLRKHPTVIRMPDLEGNFEKILSQQSTSHIMTLKFPDGIQSKGRMIIRSLFHKNSLRRPLGSAGSAAQNPHSKVNIIKKLIRPVSIKIYSVMDNSNFTTGGKNFSETKNGLKISFKIL
ncbi:hypothetical protein ES703_33097 [subsurface metagenome]